MSITQFSQNICQLLNTLNPKSKKETVIMQYGLEVLLDNLVKLVLIQLIGCLIGKGIETFVIFFIFSLFRLRAGGVHAKSNKGCMMGMMMVWIISLLSNLYLKLNEEMQLVIYLITAVIILMCVPRTINIEYSSPKDICGKKYPLYYF